MPVGDRDVLKPLMRLSLILALTIAVATLTASASPSLTVGGAQLLYSDAQMPFTMDGSFATLKRDATTQFYWHTYGPTTYKYFGPITNPLQTLAPGWPKDISQMWNANGFAGNLWLVNLYKISGTTLLGFVHREGAGVGAPFAVGLGYSTNNGETWRYLGDILSPIDTNTNMTGVPYLIVGPYMYVYYNETNLGNSHQISVARAPLSEVLTAASSGTVSTWVKYSGDGLFNTNAFTGRGANIIGATQWFNGVGIVHTDAAHSTPLNKYMLLVSSESHGQLILYLSDDGVNWPGTDAVLIDQNTKAITGAACCMNQQYAAFVSQDPNASDDSLEVGADFWVIYPYKDWPNNYDYDELYRRHVTVGSPSAPTAPGSLQLSSLRRRHGSASPYGTRRGSDVPDRGLREASELWHRGG